jgi:hypothetical protein
VKERERETRLATIFLSDGRTDRTNIGSSESLLLATLAVVSAASCKLNLDTSKKGF